MSGSRPSGVSRTRRPRLSDAETAARVLAAAVEEIAASGVHVALDQVSFERAIAAAGVSRASAYRRWPTRQAFHADVLAEAARHVRLEPDAEAEVDAVLAAIHALLPDAASEQGRRDLVVEAFRLAVGFDLARLRSSTPYRTYLALAAALNGLPDGVRAEVAAALTDTQRRFDEHRARTYAGLPDLLGYRFASPAGAADPLTRLARASGALMTGILLRSFADPATVTDTVELAPFGSSAPRRWTEPELELVGLFLTHLEPDPSVTWDDARIARSLALLADRAAWAGRLRGAGA